MGFPVDNNKFRNLYEDPNVHVSSNPLAAPQKPFNINAAENPQKTKKDKEKKKDKDGKDVDDEEEEDKPLPRPMGL